MTEKLRNVLKALHTNPSTFTSKPRSPQEQSEGLKDKTTKPPPVKNAGILNLPSELILQITSYLSKTTAFALSISHPSLYLKCSQAQPEWPWHYHNCEMRTMRRHFRSVFPGKPRQEKNLVEDLKAIDAAKDAVASSAKLSAAVDEEPHKNCFPNRNPRAMWIDKREEWDPSTSCAYCHWRGRPPPCPTSTSPTASKPKSKSKSKGKLSAPTPAPLLFPAETSSTDPTPTLVVPNFWAPKPNPLRAERQPDVANNWFPGYKFPRYMVDDRKVWTDLTRQRASFASDKLLEILSASVLQAGPVCDRICASCAGDSWPMEKREWEGNVRRAEFVLLREKEVWCFHCEAWRVGFGEFRKLRCLCQLDCGVCGVLEVRFVGAG